MGFLVVEKHMGAEGLQNLVLGQAAEEEDIEVERQMAGGQRRQGRFCARQKSFVGLVQRHQCAVAGLAQGVHALTCRPTLSVPSQRTSIPGSADGPIES